MSGKITREDVLHVARLARLQLGSEEISAMERDLGAILEAFESLGRVDVSGVEPMVHPVSDLGGLREDVVLPSLKRREALAQAPAPRNHAFSVPKVL